MQDTVAFRRSAISEIRDKLDILVGNDAEKIIRLIVLTLGTGNAPIRQPPDALRELAALLEVTDIGALVDEDDDAARPVARSITSILYAD